MEPVPDPSTQASRSNLATSHCHPCVLPEVNMESKLLGYTLNGDIWAVKSLFLQYLHPTALTTDDIKAPGDRPE